MADRNTLATSAATKPALSHGLMMRLGMAERLLAVSAFKILEWAYCAAWVASERFACVRPLRSPAALDPLVNLRREELPKATDLMSGHVLPIERATSVHVLIGRSKVTSRSLSIALQR
jgi:hypothetical protein